MGYRYSHLETFTCAKCEKKQHTMKWMKNGKALCCNCYNHIQKVNKTRMNDT